jgi:Flp pilus assembly protein TadG
MRRRQAATGSRDRGAVAVEFALLLPVLLLLLFGVIDFGRLINAEITLSQAAREGVRLAAFGAINPAVQNRVTLAAAPLTPVTATVTTACAAGAGAGADAKVTVTYTFNFITPVGAFAAMFGTASFGTTLPLTVTGEMPCET